MGEEKATWYELPNVTRIPLHVNDVENLRNVFKHPGWATWIKVVRAEAGKAGSDGLNLRVTEEERLQGTAAFSTLAWVLQFETALDVETQGAEPVKHDELKQRYDPPLLDLISKESS